MKNFKFLCMLIALAALSILPARTHWQGPYEASTNVEKKKVQITAKATKDNSGGGFSPLVKAVKKSVGFCFFC